MKFFIFFIFLFSTLAFADKPPIDSSGNPTTDCIKLKTSQSQSSNIDIRRFIILTESQMKIISPSWKTKSIGIVSENWDDCTCGMIYAFWTDLNEISIPKHLVDSEKYFQKSPEIDKWDFLDHLNKIIIMDTKGLFYKGGKPVSLTDLKEEYIKNQKPLTIVVPSVRILKRNKTETYLKNLTDAGIRFIVFG